MGFVVYGFMLVNWASKIKNKAKHYFIIKNLKRRLNHKQKTTNHLTTYAHVSFSPHHHGFL